jgi:hypothetical protein
MQGNRAITQPHQISAHPGLDLELYPVQFCRLIGLPDDLPVYTALDQLMGGFIEVRPENFEKINFLLSMTAAQNPQNFMEAQLIIQMLLCHRLSATMLKKSGKEMFPDNANKFVNMGTKLIRAYQNGLDALSKIRRDGKQSFYIEHVHIEKDDRAVIGNINRGL